MKECKKYKKEMVAFLSGELPEEKRNLLTAHLKQCPHCREEFNGMKWIIEEANSLQSDIEQAMASVDWKNLPLKITKFVYQKKSTPGRAVKLKKGLSYLLQPRLRPVYAGLLVGILIGFLATLVIFKAPPGRKAGKGEFLVSSYFLEKAELEIARRETLDYLDRSQYLLLDFVQSSAEKGREFWTSDYAYQRARGLLSQKKYINPQLQKFQMAKAKEICDQIELLFYELIQMSDLLSEEELQRIKKLIEEKQLLLKIKLLRKELKESEV